MKKLRQQAVRGVSPGDTWSFSRTFTEQDTMAFGDLTRDYNPVHYDDRFIQAKGLKGPICHGLLTASMISQVGGQLGWLAASMHFDFLKPVFFGDTVTCRLEVQEINEKGFARVFAEFHNAQDQCVLKADLTGILPSQEEKEVLQSMIDEGDPTNKLAV